MFFRAACFSMLVMSLLAGQSSPPSTGTSAGFGMAGTIVDAASGTPLARARVTISSMGHDASITVLTGEDGRFAFAGLAAGKYTLRAQRAGYLTQSFDQHDFFYTSIVVGPEFDSGNVVFPLFRECSISGSITDEAGEAVPDAQVSLFRTVIANGHRLTILFKANTADDEGSYEFSHLPGGRYFVAVSAKPWYAQHPPSKLPTTLPQSSAQLDVVYPTTFYAGATEPDSAQPVDLKAGEQFVADVELQPVPANRLHFNSGEAGSRITSVQLESRSFDTEIPVLAETLPNSSGAMDVLGVPPGRYRVEVSSDGDKNPPASREIEVSNSGGVETVRGSPSVIAEVTLRLDSGTTFPADSSFLFHNSVTGENFGKELGGRSGIEYKQRLPVGEYVLGVNDTTGLYIKTISAIGATVIGRTVAVKAAPAIRVEVVIARALAKITGVALRAGKPIPGAMVLLVPSDPAHNSPLFRNDQSDSDGSFTLLQVPPGEYTLLAIEKGWDLEWRNPAELKPYLAQGQVLRVQENQGYQMKLSVQ